ncbi:MAG: acyl-CoA thioesterase [Salibacteraceae bacterium]|nr:acyl-CoA thioesterase [Salibacteraceae bacterium]
MSQIKFKTNLESEVTISELMLPSHSNFGGKIHGGYILSLMDSVAFACASKHSGNYCVTASVNKVDFLLPIEVGELVTMRARVNYVGKTSMVVGIRVESENIRTGETKHCNSSYFTMVAKTEEGETVEVPGLELNTKEDARRYLRSIERMTNAHQRTQRYSEEYFDLDANRALLQNKKVLLQV